jgi:hypothetical protein
MNKPDIVVSLDGKLYFVASIEMIPRHKRKYAEILGTVNCSS